MDVLLTLPRQFARYLEGHREDFPQVTAVYSDPEGRKVGSGGGTVNALWQHGMGSGRRMVIHSDGQSRRLPAYAPCGKSFIPFPVFKWGRGQRIDQSLLDLQLPLLKKILERAPRGQDTLVVSGDALVYAEFCEVMIPEADVVCIGVWTRPETASKHGVFVVPRHDPSRLQYMLQKPSAEQLQSLAERNMYLLDTGIWLLSDRAVEFLFRKTGWDPGQKSFQHGMPDEYDLYSEFGGLLGEEPGRTPELTTRIVQMEKAEFYHFGSNSDLLRSTRKIHDRVIDQREIWHKKVKPAPEIFVQNAGTGIHFNETQASVWIENACIPGTWTLHDHHILTGIPENDWHLDLAPGTCLDMVPVGPDKWCIRPYGFNDACRGRLSDPSTLWMNRPAAEWFRSRMVEEAMISGWNDPDIYDAPLFPIVHETELSGEFVHWMVKPPDEVIAGENPFKQQWLHAERFSAGEVITRADHRRIQSMRAVNAAKSMTALARNHRRSVFYQLDLEHLAGQFRKHELPPPPPLEEDTDVMTRVHDLMFRSVYFGNRDQQAAGDFEKEAFARLSEGMVANLAGHPADPVLHMQRDQILWARCPVRLDLAGGWTDTPPYCLLYGGRVVNLAVELNGQPPVQVYIRPTTEPEIVIHSIDLGVSERLRTYGELDGVSVVGSAFAIPRAALKLAGFYPGFSRQSYKTLEEQLRAFGGGLDISMMIAVPKGSGLGTSSIVAAALLGGLSECCSLGWDRQEICYRALLLEQMLTTGGGWQDQMGGIYEGIKLLESTPGLVQRPTVSWAPDHLFTRPDSKGMILLYYTGITRIAKTILADIVRGMFLNSSRHLAILEEMKLHAASTLETIRHQDWNGLTSAIRYSWELNRRLDSGTNPPEVASIIRKISDCASAFKLLGAGGGGYLMIFAKDPAAAVQIRLRLEANPPNAGARFVDWELSAEGLAVTKS